MKKGQFFIWAKKVISVLLAISYVLAVFEIIMSQMFPVAICLIALPIVTTTVVLLAYVGLKRTLSTAKSVALVFCSILLICVNTYLFFVSKNTLSFLNNIQSQNYAYEQYSIIAKKDLQVNLKGGGLTVGVLNIDPNKSLVTTEVSKIAKTPNYTDCEGLAGLTVALNNGQVNTAAIKDVYLQLIEENYNDFYQNLVVLDTFTVKVATSSDSVKTDVTRPFVIYFSGADGGINSTARSDSNIVVVVNPQTHKILMVNTPRDYYVQLHDVGDIKDKLTHAGIYGINTSLKTLEDLYDVDINYYLKFDFNSLISLVDILGGVDVYSEYDFSAGSYTFTKGSNNMDGKKALAFARERYSFEQGDRVRGQNQQRLIEAIIQKIATPKTLVNYQQILQTLNNKVQTNASTEMVAGLINQQMNSLSKWQVKSISVDGAGKKTQAYSTGNLQVYVMEPDEQSVQNAKNEIDLFLQY
ncbi:MAG: LCP family protein [Candidatus Woesebacteria bacterium]|jgi:LCP family protein required for cell wall assembly